MKNCSDYSPAQDCDFEANTTDVIIIYNVREKLFLKNSCHLAKFQTRPRFNNSTNDNFENFVYDRKKRKEIMHELFRDDESLIAQIAEIKM